MINTPFLFKEMSESMRDLAHTTWKRGSAVEESLYLWKNTPVEFVRTKPLDKKKPIVVELFCGCGGTTIGLEMAGFCPALGIDILEPALATFRQTHQPATTILGDIKKVDVNRVIELLDGREVDILAGGFPCQGFSLNNRKRHDADPRNQLFKQFVRFARALKPKAVLAENVSSIRSAAGGDIVKKIIEELGAAIDSKVEFEVLNAADFGVPQVRKRMIFLGIQSVIDPFKLIVRTHGTTKNPWVTVSEALSDLPSLNAGETAINYRFKAQNEFQRIMRQGSSKLIQNHQAPSHPAATIKRIGSTSPGEPMYSAFKQRIRLHKDRPSPTQVCGGIRPQFQFGHYKESRGLSIRERARLQSIPDKVLFSGGLVQGRVQTGNAVSPLMAKAIGEAIAQALGINLRK